MALWLLALLPIAVSILIAYMRRRRTQCWYAQSSGDTVPDVIIVGSGVLGTALATTLARDGRVVTVLERSLVAATRIVGEYLQPGGVSALTELGLNSCLGNIDCVSSRGLHVFPDNTVPSEDIDTYLYYPDEYTAVSFHYEKFVMALRDLAYKEGRCNYIEGTALSLLEEDGAVNGILYREKHDGEEKELRAPLTIIADGSFSRMRKGLVSGRSQDVGHFAGSIYKGVLPGVEGYLALCLTNTSFVYVYQVSPTETRFQADIKGPLRGDLKQHLLDMVPELPESLRKAYTAAVESGPTKATTQTLDVAPCIRPGVIPLGDSFNMRHPVTGSGMTVALRDVIFWRDQLRGINDLRDRSTIMKAHRLFTRDRKLKYSSVANMFASILYTTLTPQSALEREIRADFMRCIRGRQNVYNGIAGVFGLVGTPLAEFVRCLLTVAFAGVVRVWKEEIGFRCRVGKLARMLWKNAHLIPLLWTEFRTAFFF